MRQSVDSIEKFPRRKTGGPLPKKIRESIVAMIYRAGVRRSARCYGVSEKKAESALFDEIEVRMDGAIQAAYEAGLRASRASRHPAIRAAA